VIVRLEEPGDRADSIAVEREAFDGPVEAGIVEAVRDEPGSFALVAEEESRIVGHVQMSRAWVGERAMLALGPIGVTPDRQGRGIGAALVRASLEEAASRGEIAVILLGSPAYYGRHGFRSAAGFGLRNPYAGTTDHGFMIAEEDFQIAPLDGESAGRLRGEVRWHPAFG
jgi:predicted N-acetyltransferase YhbS